MQPRNNSKFKEKYFNLIVIFVMMITLIFSIIIKEGKISIVDGLIVLALFLILSFEFKIIACFLLLPFQSILVINEISFYSLVQIVTLLTFLVRKELPSKMELLTLLLLFILQLFTILFFGTSIVDLINYITTIILFIVVMNYIKKNPKKLKNFKTAYITGLLLATTIGYVLFKQNIIIFDSTSYRFSGLWLNPNILGFQLLVAIAILLDATIKKWKRWYIFIPLIIIFAFYMSLTYSRSAVVILSIILILFIMKIIYLTINTPGNNQKLLLILSLGLALITASVLFSQFLYPVIVRRTILDDESGFGGGRIKLLAENLSWLFQSGTPTFIINGIGINNSMSYYTSKGFLTLGTHNTFAELFIETGFLGLLIWLYLIVSKFKSNKLLNVNILIVSVALIYMFVAHLHLSNILYVALILSFDNSKKRFSV